MGSRESVTLWTRFVLGVLLVALVAVYVASASCHLSTRAQSPLPTFTFTPRASSTPVPPTPTDTPAPLVCAGAVPSIARLWPPNHSFVAISVLGVQGESVAIAIDSIFQDELVYTPGTGSTSPDGRGVGTATAQVRSERDGSANGRIYHIAFTAEDAHGGTCSGEVLVGVPQSEAGAPVDDGALYESTVAMPRP